MALPPVGRFLVVGSVLGLTLAGVSLPASAAPAPTATAKAPTSFTVDGRGFGHGWGMSQYGAYGAAKKGLTWPQIMDFYYPGTKVGDLASKAKIRVKISADDDGKLTVRGVSGMRLRDADGTSVDLPTGATYRFWRVVRSGSSFKLQHRAADATYATYATPKALGGKRWSFSTGSGLVTVYLPHGAGSKTVRGSVSAAAWSSTMRTVNTLTMESYLRSVVPMEMPTSWAPEAVRAQAVAARSYAARTKLRAGSAALYDICDTTACQVYQGYARTTSWGITHNETSGGDAAVKATAGKVLRYGDTVALTQFASSNGGATAQGDFPYLAAHPDPYDDVVTSSAWSRTIKASTVRSVWPSVGTVKSITVTERDGSGAWGGRATKVKIVGSKKSITVSGTSFGSVFGLRSTLFTVS